MSSLLRRLPFTRLLLLCGALFALGASGAAIASAIDAGPLPAPKSLANAVHDALGATPVEGISARIEYTNHLLEGAGLAGASGSAGALASSPLLQGASGRLWAAGDGRVRLELQADGGDTQVVLANRTVSIYGVSPGTVYRYTLPKQDGEPEDAQSTGSGWTPYAQLPPSARSTTPSSQHEVPSVARIEEAISRLGEHANVSGPTPANVAGQPAYTVRISPKEQGSLLGAAELSWDAVHGVPLRAAVYATHSASPVIELAASEISYGPIDSSVFEIKPPAGAKIVEPHQGQEQSGPAGSSAGQGHAHLRRLGHGITSVLALETPLPANGAQTSSAPSGLQKVDVNGATGYELPSALGTLLTFERAGVSYLLFGALKPAAVEAAARGL